MLQITAYRFRSSEIGTFGDCPGRRHLHHILVWNLGKFYFIHRIGYIKYHNIRRLCLPWMMLLQRFRYQLFSRL